MVDLTQLILCFLEHMEKENIEIYNEYSFQFELGLSLRKKLLGQGYKVQFERNVSFFDISTKEMVKKEIDISIFNEDKSEKYAIELKYPTNGQIPERMYAFVKDVKFIEQLKINHEFIKTVAVVLVDDKRFYQGRIKSGIYNYFRNEYSIYGEIQKPTGNRDETIKLNGKYDFKWIPLQGERKYYIIEI